LTSSTCIVGVSRLGGVPEGAGLIDFGLSDLSDESSLTLTVASAMTLAGLSLGPLGGLSFIDGFA